MKIGKTQLSKNKSKAQGHPARVNRDNTNVEIEKLSMRLTKLVPIVIRDKRFDPEDVVIAKATAVGSLHLYSVLEDKPSPFELYKQQMAHARKVLTEIQELHSAIDSMRNDQKICGGCSSRLSETLFPCDTRKLADQVIGVS